VNYSREAQHLANEISIGIANWATGIAIADVKWLLGAFGSSTEPDLVVILPIYDRMLAISLLLLGAVVAFALIERIAWGSLGTGLALIPRVVAACFAAYAGLGVVKYAAGYAALLATAWSGDFANLSNVLSRNVATSNAGHACKRVGTTRQHLRPDCHRTLSQLARCDGSPGADHPLGSRPHRHSLRASGLRVLNLAAFGQRRDDPLRVPHRVAALEVRRRNGCLRRLSPCRRRSDFANEHPDNRELDGLRCRGPFDRRLLSPHHLFGSALCTHPSRIGCPELERCGGLHGAGGQVNWERNQGLKARCNVGATALGSTRCVPG
jgi:hypothetical protein